MHNRDADIDEFLKYIKQFKYSEKEQKELKSILKKVVEINNLRNETKQKKVDYKYFKLFMLPSDYTKINSDLKQQKEFKVDREAEKYRKELKNKQLKEEEIEEKVQELIKDLRKQYGLSTKGKNDKKVSEENALNFEDVENDNFEEE
ncbi:MAG: hypothetical protein IJH39_01800 [Clostridia bacterium]|nr:hypothetical protein [Clostridia bacterium]